MSVRITVNGKPHEVEGGGWLIDTLNALGCDIPHFCYHPGLGPDGNCRMCQVEFVTERGGRLAISCNARVTDGLNIVTNSDSVVRARAAVEEFLLLNHPLDCPICDKAGECTLQNYYMQHDLKTTRQEFRRFTKDKAMDIGPTMVLDQERCVLCNRCVRFLRDWSHNEQLYIAGRGHEAYLTAFPGKPVSDPYSLNTVDLCPVGALTSKDFRFAVPTWFLKRTPSTCTTCARGCAIEIDSRDKTVHRLRPRYNPQVNGHWMCDEGRLNYTFVNTDRIKDARVTRDGHKFETSVENGMTELRAMLSFAAERGQKLVMLASATCTLEEMYLLHKLSAAYPAGVFFVARHVADGEEDDLLRRADRHPNVMGAEILGVDIADFREGAASRTPATGDLLLAVGFDYGVGTPLEQFCKGFNRVAVIASREGGMSALAHVLIPGLTFAEKDGLIVNFEGHVQRLEPALDNLWDRTAPWELIADLIKALTGEPCAASIRDVRKRIGNEVTGFSGLDLNAVGPTGVRAHASAASTSPRSRARG